MAENPAGKVAINASFDEPKKWDLDDAGNRIARYRRSTYGFGLDLGTPIGTTGELRLGFNRGRLRLLNDTGVPSGSLPLCGQPSRWWESWGEAWRARSRSGRLSAPQCSTPTDPARWRKVYQRRRQKLPLIAEGGSWGGERGGCCRTRAADR